MNNTLDTAKNQYKLRDTAITKRPVSTQKPVTLQKPLKLKNKAKAKHAYKLIVVAVAVAYGLLLWSGSKKSEPLPNTAPVKIAAMQARPQSMPKLVESSSKAIPEVAKQREAFNDAMRLRVGFFKPTLKDNNWAFTFNFLPITRSCVNGDVDLIRRVVKPGSSLMWTWEDQNGKSVVPPIQISESKLDQPFSKAVTLPIANKPKYYRLSLCTAQGSSCKDAEPMNFDAVQKDNNAESLAQNHLLFFSQSFRVDGQGIQIFDSRETTDTAAYHAYAKKVDGTSEAEKFMTSMIAGQRILKSLPVVIKGQQLEINLYARENKDCF